MLPEDDADTIMQCGRVTHAKDNVSKSHKHR